MARISGIDLPKEKQVDIALTYLFGVGLVTSQRILDVLKISRTTRVKDLSENEILGIRDEVRNIVHEGDLRRQLKQNLDRLAQTGTYRGQRHRRRLPARGQKTKTNARTRRGKRIAIAGKKKVTK